jgi:hypothetical protein
MIVCFVIMGENLIDETIITFYNMFRIFYSTPVLKNSFIKGALATA